jgi:hypothetical protein
LYNGRGTEFRLAAMKEIEKSQNCSATKVISSRRKFCMLNGRFNEQVKHDKHKTTRTLVQGIEEFEHTEDSGIQSFRSEMRD